MRIYGEDRFNPRIEQVMIVGTRVASPWESFRQNSSSSKQATRLELISLMEYKEMRVVL